MNSAQPKTPFAQRGGILPWLAGGFVLVCAVIAGGFIGFWLFINLWFGLSLSEQPLAITLPPELEVTAEVTNVLDIVMNGDIHAEVPFDRVLQVPFRGEYDIDIQLDTLVPVEFEVIYEGIIPVDTYADIEARTTLDFKTIKQFRNLLIKARLPLKFDLPVKLRVPVKDNLRFTYNGPIKAVLNQNLEARVNTVLKTTLPVNQTVSAPVTRSFGLNLHLPQDPVRAIINEADLHIELDTLKLGIADDNDKPTRLASPYGPAALDTK